MAQLRQDFAKFQVRQAEVLVVGHEPPRAFSRYWSEHDLPFRGLPDPKGRVLRRYGQEVNLFKFGRMPAQVIIDRQGQVRYVHFGGSMADIPENEELFQILDQLNQEEQNQVN